MMSIIAMKKGNQVDSMMRVTASQTSSASAIAKNLQLGLVKRRGGQVFTSDNGYIIKGMSGMPTKAFIDLLKKDNKSVIDVNYQDGLEGNDQISETEEPLWKIDKSNGNFNIKRNF